jgi:tRNA (mo5U34)-methyltransferase
MERLLSHTTQLGLDPHRSDLEACITTLTRTMALDYGNEKTWRDVVEHLPVLNPSRVDFSGDWVRIGNASDISADQHQNILRRLKALSPWRKGPFELFGIPIDTEWASNIKWNRLLNNISPLNGKRVLDVGCNSGYYMFRMLPDNPEMVLGIDPQILFYYQFKILQRYAGVWPLYFLPARLEDLPVFTGYFDTVFWTGN